MFFFTGPLDFRDRFAEFKPDGTLPADGSQVFEQFSILQEVGTQS